MHRIVLALLLTLICFVNVGMEAFETSYNCNYITGSIDFLYWRVCPDRDLFTNQALVEDLQVVSEEPPVTSLSILKVQNNFLTGDLEPGVRVGLQWHQFCGTNWDLWVNYLHYCFTKKENVIDKIRAEDAPTLFRSELIRTDPLSFPFVADKVVPTTWELEYRTVHFGLSSKNCLECGLVLHPKTAIRFTCLDSFFKQKQNGELADITNPEAFVSNYSANQQLCKDYWGIGPEIGLTANWEIGCGLGLYSDTSFSLLYGRIKRVFQDLYTRFDSVNSANDTDCLKSKSRNEEIYCTQAMAGIGVGAFWDLPCICGLSSHLQIGWEHQMYFHRLDDDSNVSFQGLAVSGSIGF